LGAWSTTPYRYSHLIRAIHRALGPSASVRVEAEFAVKVEQRLRTSSREHKCPLCATRHVAETAGPIQVLIKHKSRVSLIVTAPVALTAPARDGDAEAAAGYVLRNAVRQLRASHALM